MNTFWNFFKKKQIAQELPPVNLSDLIKVDMHGHLLPGIDDGAQTMEESIKLIKGLINLGYSKVLCTPHVMFDFYKNSTETILDSLKKLQEELQKRGIQIPIEVSAEYYLDEELFNRVKKNDILSFGPENYLLFEFSYFNEHQGIFDAVTDMIQAGYTPVLAHPERYPYYVAHPEKYDQLKNLGLKFQLNLLSLTGYYGESALYGSKYLIDKEYIDFIGSDIHKESQIIELEKSLKTNHLHQLIDSKKLLNYTLE